MSSGTAGTSTVAANKAVLRRLPEDLYNERNIHVADEIFAPDVKVHTHIRPGPQGLAPGLDGIREMAAWVWHGWPESRITVDQMIGEGDVVALRFTFSGVHAGVLHGNRPTGRSAAWQEVFFARVSDGKIQELWHELDVYGILERVGVLAPIWEMGPMPAPVRMVVKQLVRLKRRMRGPRYSLDSWRETLELRQAQSG